MTETTCRIATCAKAPTKVGMCGAHYERQRKGLPLVPPLARQGVWDVPDHRKCARCGEYKPFSEYRASRTARGGITNYCRPCHSATAADGRLIRKYGLTRSDVDFVTGVQGGRCAICRRPADLVVDHDHVTGDVRGLLCSPCNTIIGLAGDSPGTLRRAAGYLEEASWSG